jgi:hypothetical protein
VEEANLIRRLVAREYLTSTQGVLMHDHELYKQLYEAKSILIEVKHWFDEHSPGDYWEYPDFLNKFDVWEA